MDSMLRWAVRIRDWHPSTEEWQFLLQLIPTVEQRQIGEFKFLEDRKRRLISQLLQRKCISEALLIPWSQIRIRKTKGKKPWVLCEGVEKDHAPNFNFNVSHEGEYVALASEPLSICGVDVSAPQQFRGQRRASLDELLANIGSVFTHNEILAMRRAGETEEERQNAFRRFWSLKEALGKARGDGLGMEFSKADFSITNTTGEGWRATVEIDGAKKPRWRFYLQELGDGHWISVSRGPPEDIVDAWGDFTDSLDVLKLSDAEMQRALNTPNPPFSILQPVDLIPAEKVDQYEAILEVTQ